MSTNCDKKSKLVRRLDSYSKSYPLPTAAALVSVTS